MSFSSIGLPEQFDKEYATLDFGQQQAVDAGEGPVIISGAPGTGKTQVLATRIAHLLQKRAAVPGNILCLTASGTGASAIRDHLQQLSGADAHKINIYTISTFCAALMQENPGLFKKEGQLPVSSLERIDLLTRLIDTFPKGHPLKRYRGDVYYEAANLAAFFNTMRQAGWTSDYLQQLTTQPDEEATTEETERVEKLRAAAHEYHNYQQLLQDRNRYEEDDVVQWVIRAFEDSPSLLQHYQQQYKYVLADDYQEFSRTQRRLIELLTSYSHQPNLFVATTDDKGIGHLPGIPFRLTTTYRKTQTELHRFHEYEWEWQEMTGIALQVQELLQQGALPEQICILCEEDTYVQKLTQYFRLVSISVQGNNLLNIFDDPLARKIILLFNYLAAEQHIATSGDEILFELLHADWFNIPPATIARLTVELSESGRGDHKTSLRSLLYGKVHTPPLDLFTPPVHEGLKLASQAIEQLIALPPGISLPSLLERMIEAVNLPAYIQKSPDRLFLQQTLASLTDWIKEEAQRNPSLDLQQLVKLLSLARWTGITERAALNNPTGIHLLTVQAAKRLSFDYVFLAGCTDVLWENKYRNTTGYSLPDKLLPAPVLIHTDWAIAISRARQQLTVSYSRLRNNGKEVVPTSLIEETWPQLLSAEKITLPEGVLGIFQELYLPETMAPEISRPEEPLINRLLEKFMLSATALNNYLYCPLEFYYSNILRVPSPRNEATEFGSAVHHALELLFRKMQADYEAFPSKAVFISDFEQYMHQQRGSFTPDQFSRRMEYGREVLSNYYDKYSDSWNTIVAVERNFRNVIVDGVPLKGKIDKLEFDGRMVNIVDYKTGDPERAMIKMQPPNEMMPAGGDYWRQAVFYKILVDNYKQKEWKAASGELDLIEPDKKRQYHKLKHFINAGEVAIVMQQITASWWRIQNRDFYTGCGKPGCYWCQFVKTNRLALAWHPQKERGT